MGTKNWLDRLDELPATVPFTTAEAAAVGLHTQALHRLTVAGRLRRPVEGVYVAADVPDSLALRCRMLALVIPRDCFVCDRTAAWLHAGDRALAPNEHLEPPVVSCFRPSDRGRLRNALSASGERAVRRSDLMEIDGLTVTTPLRTALDLGRLQPTADLRLHGMDTMLALGTFTRDELLAEVPRFRRQRGVVQLKLLAPEADGGSESFGESAVRLRWRGAGLPRPTTQIPVKVDGREICRLDLGLEELRFAAEYDGELWHGDDRTAHDDERRRWLADERGWVVEVFRREHVFGHQQDVERRLMLAYQAVRARLGLTRTHIC